jgi:hypothetical protein
MDVTVLLFLLLGSSTVQLHGSLGSRQACECSEAGSSSKNGDGLEGYTTEEWRSLLRFLMGKGTQCKEYSLRNVSCLRWEVFVA